MSNWLAKTETAFLLSISRQGLEKQIHSGKLVARKVPNERDGRGGFKYEILLSSLPKVAQERYWAQVEAEKILAQSAKKSKTPPDPQEEKEAEISDFYLEAPDWQKKRIDKWVWILKETEYMRKSEIEDWIKNNGEKITYSAICKKRKVFKKEGTISLVPAYGKRSGDSKILDDVFEVFKNSFLREGTPSAEAAYQVALGFCITKSGNWPQKNNHETAEKLNQIINKYI